MFFVRATSNAHEDPAVIVLLGGWDEASAGFGLGVNVIREVAPGNVASRGFRPPAHQALSISKRLLRTVPPLALGADFLILLSWALVSAPPSASY